jgi:hypothetical protein
MEEWARFCQIILVQVDRQLDQPQAAAYLALAEGHGSLDIKLPKSVTTQGLAFCDGIISGKVRITEEQVAQTLQAFFAGGTFANTKSPARSNGKNTGSRGLSKQKPILRAAIAAHAGGARFWDAAAPPVDDVCAICYEGHDATTVRLHCPAGHVFHQRCIEVWFSSIPWPKRCPTCQREVADVNPADADPVIARRQEAAAYMRFAVLSQRAVIRTTFENNDAQLPDFAVRAFRWLMISPQTPRIVKAWLYVVYRRSTAGTLVVLLAGMSLGMLIGLAAHIGLMAIAGRPVLQPHIIVSIAMAVAGAFFFDTFADDAGGDPELVPMLRLMLLRIREFEGLLDRYAANPEDALAVHAMARFFTRLGMDQRATVAQEGRRALRQQPQPLFGNIRDWNVPADLNGPPLDWPLPPRHGGSTRRRRARHRRRTMKGKSRHHKPQPHSILKWMQ